VFYRLSFPEVADLLSVARGLLAQLLHTTQEQLASTAALPDLGQQR